MREPIRRPRQYPVAAADKPNLPRAAPDALHLALAAPGGHALATLDARLAEGARAVGVRVVGV